jgi:Rod binding domain-containing protein
MPSNITASNLALMTLGRGQQEKLAQTQKGPESKETRQAFEGILLKQLVSAMRRTVSESGLLGSSSGSQMYDHLIEEAMTEQMKRAGGIGLGKLFQQRTPQDLQDPGPGTEMLDRRLGLTSRRQTQSQPIDSARAKPLSAELTPQDEQRLENSSTELALRRAATQQADAHQPTPNKEK